MDSRTNTHVIARTETRAKLWPVPTEEYFACQPALEISHRPGLRRGLYPKPLFLSNEEPCGPVTEGPRGWNYTKLSTRSYALESFRDDHGVRYKQRLSVGEVLLGFKWHLLLNEDAPPARAKDHCKEYLKATYKSSKEGMTRCVRYLHKSGDWLWRKLVFWRPELDELNDTASYRYWRDVEPGLMYNTDETLSLLGHVI